MSALGVLEQDCYCLCHLDLEPCNILANDASVAQTTHVISGILDWDGAIFAPLFMSCSPPMWLWAWNSEGDEDERLADDVPATGEQCQLKRLLEDAAGQMYGRFAYAAENRLARRLVRFAIDGLRPNEDFVDADSFLREWALEKETQLTR